MPGYLPPTLYNVSGKTYNALLYCKTNIGGYFFDGFINVSHNRELELTSNPVETGAAIVDHAYVKPATLTMTVKMSDAHRSLVNGQFEGGRTRSINAWATLKELQAARVPMTVLTRLDIYKNMLITGISTDDTYATLNSLEARVNLQEIPVARVKTVKITSAPQTTITTENAKVEAQTVNESILYQLFSSLGYNFSD